MSTIPRNVVQLGSLALAAAASLLVPTIAGCSDGVEHGGGSPASHDAGPSGPASPTPGTPAPPPASPTPASPGTPPAPAPTPSAGRCMASTSSCLAACTDEACVDGCFGADPTCGECLDEAFFACAERRGCVDELDALDTCAAACTDDACVESSCSMQLQAFYTCLPEGACDAEEMACF